MSNEECITRMQQLSEEMYHLVRDLALSDQYQNALDNENRRLIEENRELKRELEILRSKSGRTQNFQSTKNQQISKRQIETISNEPNEDQALTIQFWLEDQSRSMSIISDMVGRPRATVWRWIKLYKEQDTTESEKDA